MTQINSVGANPIVVANGGTGAATLTLHGVLLGNGTSTVQALAEAATGTILAGATGANPAFTATPSGLTSLSAGTLSSTTTITAGTTLTATLGDITATNGDIVASTAAKGPKVVATSVTGATPVTNSVRVGRVGFSDVINAAANVALTLTNSLVSTSSIIHAVASCATAGSACVIRDIVPGTGSVAFNVTNLGGSNTATTVFITFWVLN